MPRNNPLCRLIDQITSRWNTLSNSDHHTHRPSGTRHFYSCSLTLIAPSISRLTSSQSPPSPMSPLTRTSGQQSRESAIFYFTYVEEQQHVASLITTLILMRIKEKKKDRGACLFCVVLVNVRSNRDVYIHIIYERLKITWRCNKFDKNQL